MQCANHRHSKYILGDQYRYLWSKIIQLKVAFYQKVWSGSKKNFKSPSWAENLTKLSTVLGGKFKFSDLEKVFSIQVIIQIIFDLDKDLEYFFELHQTFWQKATFSSLAIHITVMCSIHSRCPVPSTDQALPSCFYFRISWILMERP